MALMDELTARMKAAMKAKDQRVLDTIRMVRSRVIEVQNAADFSGELTDDVVRDVIAAYSKQLKKSLPDYERAGESGHEMAEKLRFEVDYLSEFLPSMLDEDATRAIVAATVAELGVTDPRRAGQVMGAVMKANKGRVEPGLVKRLVDEALAGGGTG